MIIHLYCRTLFKTVSTVETHTYKHAHKLMFPIDCAHIINGNDFFASSQNSITTISIGNISHSSSSI